MATMVEKDLRKDLDNMQSLQQALGKLIQTREKLLTQYSENKMVNEELCLVKEGDVVFKLMGPALIKQDLVEAKGNVTKRLGYIEAELKRYDDLIKENEEQVAQLQEKVLKYKEQIDKERAGKQPQAV